MLVSSALVLFTSFENEKLTEQSLFLETYIDYHEK
jgi:hypothetical protein